MKKAKAKTRSAPKETNIYFNADNTSYPSVPRCVKKLGWVLTQGISKNLIFWCDNNVGVEFCLSMQPWQFVNHFPGTFSISRKIELYRNYERIKKYFPDEYNFHPMSFVLPSQGSDLQRYMSSVSQKKRAFIVKPDLGAKGQGIFLIMDPDKALEYSGSAIAQQYIPPCLINGLKFDFRIYALITSIDPLKIYIYEEGMARFCTEPYEAPKPGNLSKVFCHLTNYSVNRKNDNFHQPQSSKNTENANKRSYSSVMKELAGLGHDVESLQAEIDKVIVLTILAVQPFIAHNYKASIKIEDGRSRCFEILGFDIMIDKHLKPWLLEVNHSPSFLCESPFDKELKDGVITEALKVMNFDPNFKKKILKNEKLKTKQRINGYPLEIAPIVVYDPVKEEEIASTQTKWRKIFPCTDSFTQTIYDDVFEQNSSLPIEGTDETAATRHRREAIQNHLKEIEAKQQALANKPKKVFITRPMSPPPKTAEKKTPRSVFLLREANLSRIKKEAARRQYDKPPSDFDFVIDQPLPISKIQPPLLRKPQIQSKVVTIELPNL